MVVVIEIAVNAALVTTISDIEMHADGDAQLQRLPIHLEEKAHNVCAGEGAASAMG